MALAFLSGYPPTPDRLLARFLPPVAEGVAAQLIERLTQPGDLILDPFGQSPQIALEALHVGRRIVVANFNPISRLALSLLARAPSEKELLAALTALADAPLTSGERLEHYLRGIYHTTCVECGAAVEADAFECDAASHLPLTKTYHCAQCGWHAQVATDEADRAQAKRFQARGLDYYRLLDRVAGRDDPDRVYAEEALAVYSPRTLAALAEALTKFETLDLNREVRRLLAGLLVVAFDALCLLTQERPKALVAPTKLYTEKNFWRALEQGVAQLVGNGNIEPALPLAELLTARAGIHAHAGPTRELAAQLPPQSCALLLSTVPRPNQAYWTLSALWAAWLWGRESANALRSVLRRRRYDWNWHTEAVQRAWAQVAEALRPAGQLIALVPEAGPGFNACLFNAADRAGFALTGAAWRSDTAEAQMVWEKSSAPTPPADLEAEIQTTALEAATQILCARGEPTRWATVHFHIWQTLAAKRLLAAVSEEPLATLNRWIQTAVDTALDLRRYGAQAGDELTVGLWFVAEGQPTLEPPLADRVEAVVARLLADGEAHLEQDLLQRLYPHFPGALTPERDLVLACLHSHAQRLAGERWQAHSADWPEQRAQETHALQAELRTLAARLGYEVRGDNPQYWHEAGEGVYCFMVSPLASLGLAVRAPFSAPSSFLVVPGGRAELIAYKLRRDPRLRAALLLQRWQIIKFSQIRRMLADEQLTRATLEPAFYADPLEEMQQLTLLG